MFLPKQEFHYQKKEKKNLGPSGACLLGCVFSIRHLPFVVWWPWVHCLPVFTPVGITIPLYFILFQVLGFPSSNQLPWMAEFRSSAMGLCWSSTWWKKTVATTCARSATMWARTSASPCTSRWKVRKTSSSFYLNRALGLPFSVVSTHTV